MAEPILNLPDEIWKPIPGYGCIYEASSVGRIRSVDRVVASGLMHSKTGLKPKRGRVITACERGTYLFVGIGTIRKMVSVHRLVLEAFVGPCPPKHCACHNNGNRHDNRVENLRWDTYSANMADKYKHGTAQIGTRNPHAKLTDNDALEIFAQRGKISAYKLAARFGVGYGVVYTIWHRRGWKHIHERIAKGVK